jgi:hypothetical protein
MNLSPDMCSRVVYCPWSNKLYHILLLPGTFSVRQRYQMLELRERILKNFGNSPRLLQKVDTTGAGRIGQYTELCVKAESGILNWQTVHHTSHQEDTNGSYTER